MSAFDLIQIYQLRSIQSSIDRAAALTLELHQREAIAAERRVEKIHPKPTGKFIQIEPTVNFDVRPYLQEFAQIKNNKSHENIFALNRIKSVLEKQISILRSRNGEAFCAANGLYLQVLKKIKEWDDSPKPDPLIGKLQRAIELFALVELDKILIPQFKPPKPSPLLKLQAKFSKAARNKVNRMATDYEVKFRKYREEKAIEIGIKTFAHITSIDTSEAKLNLLLDEIRGAGVNVKTKDDVIEHLQSRVK